MQREREEKQLEASLDALIQRVADIKNSIGSLLFKLENEYATLNWPTLMDNFALISGQINTLNKVLKNDKTPSLRNCAVLPLHLSPDRDPQLETLTEGRVSAFNHDVVPDYLRTKPEPEAEEKFHVHQTRASSLNPDNLLKQLNNLNKYSSNITAMISSTTQEWENDSSTKAMSQTSSLADTNALIAAVVSGRGLKSVRRPEPPMQNLPQVIPGQLGPMDQRGAMGQPPQGFYHAAYGLQGAPPGMAMNMKAQSTIKTNIKSANNAHPYSRPM